MILAIHGELWIVSDGITFIDCFSSVDSVQKKMYSLISKTNNFLNEVTSPVVKTGKPLPENDIDPNDDEDVLVTEQTVHSKTPSGKLSLAAIISIEKFSR